MLATSVRAAAQIIASPTDTRPDGRHIASASITTPLVLSAEVIPAVSRADGSHAVPFVSILARMFQQKSRLGGSDGDHARFGRRSGPGLHGPVNRPRRRIALGSPRQEGGHRLLSAR